MTTEDTLLVEQFCDGDTQSFEKLVEKYNKKVFFIAYYICKNYDYAYEIAQEIFIKIHNEIRKFKMKSSFYTWLYRITVNHTYSYIRKIAHIDRQLPLDETIIVSTPDSQNPSENLAQKELSAAIENAIALLPKKQRTIFVLRNFEGLSFSDIAKIIHRTEGGTKANYFHAVRNLRKMLVAGGVTYEM